jgi:hypothetical protein
VHGPVSWGVVRGCPSGSRPSSPPGPRHERSVGPSAAVLRVSSLRSCPSRLVTRTKEFNRCASARPSDGHARNESDSWERSRHGGARHHGPVMTDRRTEARRAIGWRRFPGTEWRGEACQLGVSLMAAELSRTQHRDERSGFGHDPAGGHMLVSKAKPCRSRFKPPSGGETAQGSLNRS